jgi:formate dehydrogenase family accessory protein FdhD
MPPSSTESITPQTDARRSVRVIKQRVCGTDKLVPESDFLAIEDPLAISLSYQRSGKVIEKSLSITMRTPGHDLELIHGFLFAEGIIREASDILEVRFNEPCGEEAPTQATVFLRNGLDTSAASIERNFATNASCGVCGSTQLGHLSLPKSLRIDDDTRVAADWIHELPSLMRLQQTTFKQTGGLHAAAIFNSQGQILASCEDIGRHNALDKAIGTNLLNDLCPAAGQVLCVSGRMSYEIIQKALVARIPIITGVGAPSSLAVALANDFNLTLVGFVRDGSYNIYSCPERLK